MVANISAHESRAELLSPDDVDRDVAGLSESLLEERARRIARNVLLRPDIRHLLDTLLTQGICASEEEAIVRGLKTLAVAVSPV
ncbi:MAG: hypothetical protein HY784_00220 [Chloroflexi bacterium]|nr:hypothetical protein [Chloroflexota bacterium]